MILVTGKGHLGRIIAESLGANLYEGKLEDLSDIQIDYATDIINTAAKTDLKWCEENRAEASFVNSFLAVGLYKRASKLGTRFIQLSSGCVWKGPYDGKGDPFTPNHPATPACHYAVTKASCDEELLKEKQMPGSADLAILRLRMPYSKINSDRNLLNKILKYDRVIDTPNSITSVEVLCKTLSFLTLQEKCGLWNRITCVYDAGIVTPYTIATKLYHAGLRGAPERITKYQLDQWHRPQRVDTVMKDVLFEELVKPENVGQMLDRTIAGYTKSSLA
jgi:dTDP-4-dehydrorhamnose reductase